MQFLVGGRVAELALAGEDHSPLEFCQGIFVGGEEVRRGYRF